MAKTSMVEREKKRAKIVRRYANKRSQLKAIVKSPSTSYEEKQEAIVQLQKLPVNASPTRLRNRCSFFWIPKHYLG